MNIEGKVIIITGASSGIGLATARYLGSRGAKIVLVARNGQQLKKIAEELPGSLALPTDITSPVAVEELIKQVIEHYGRVDVLINNAGRAMARPVEKISLEEYRQLLELNVVAPLHLMQQVIPYMRTQGSGMIINLSSQSSKKYIPNIAGYASTKYALNALSLTARQELAKDGIVVSTILPGIVNTEFGQHTPSPEPAMLRYAEDGTVLSHIISPEKVAKKIGELIESGEAELDITEV